MSRIGQTLASTKNVLACVANAVALYLLRTQFAVYEYRNAATT
jgi:hypothetical protein